MTWLTLALLAVCSIAFYMAAEGAGGMRAGGFYSRAALGGAAVSFLCVVAMIVHHPPTGDFEGFLGIAIPALGGLACFWMVKGHVDGARPLAAFVSAALGLTLFAVAFTLHFANPGKVAAETAGTPDGATAIEAHLRRFEETERGLDMRLMSGIPDFRRKLEADAATVKGELPSASAAAKVRLEDELREIARLMLAVDRETEETKDLIARVRQERRRLERLRDTREYLGDDQQLMAELDAVWKQAGARLSRPLDTMLGSGAVASAQVDQKVAELMGK